MTRGSMQEAVERYLAAWNEPDALVRRELIGQCWAVGGVYVDPNVRLVGAADLSNHIENVRSQRPGARLEFVSGIDCHHNVLRFLWRLVSIDGTVGATSIDFGEVGTDGKLVLIAGFFGSPPLT